MGVAYQAGASGLPCGLLRHYAETSLDRVGGPYTSTLTCPFSGDSLLAVAAINPMSQSSTLSRQTSRAMS